METTWLRGAVALALLAVSAAVAGRKLLLVYRLIRLGGGPVPIANWRLRLRDLLVQVLAHRKVLRDPLAGVMHLLIFWGFIILLSTIVQAFGEAFRPGWTLPLIGAVPWFVFLQDLVIVLVLVGIGLALWLRLAVRPRRLAGQDQAGAFLILGFISGIMISLVLSRGAGIAIHAPAWAAGAPLSVAIARALSSASAATQHFVFEASWWTHLGIVLYFLTWIPEGKHLHLITLTPNVWLRKERHRGALAPVDIEHAERLGASAIEHFTWKDYLDAYACMECGRCVEVCPANQTGKELDPRRLHTDIRKQLGTVGPQLLAGGSSAGAPALIGQVFSEAFLWQCVTCGACVEECPATNDHIDKIVEMRRHLTMEQARVPETMGDAMRSLEARGHPFRGAGISRTAWMAGLQLKRLSDGERAEWLLWVGCAAALNERNHPPLRALVGLLHAAGLDVGVLGEEETCTGDPARRMGNEYLFQTFAQQNIQTLDRYGVSKIVTLCPHCMNTLGNEYPQFGGRYEVWHHTQLLAKLVADGKLKPKGGVAETVTFHDPCYLGRHNGEYDAPRNVLAAIPGAKMVEMTNSRERSFCCGAGGGLYWMEDRAGQRISHARTQQAQATGAGIMATACPFCVLMIEDGAAATQATVRPMDVAELLSRSVIPETQ
jgi:Fe-S oxidoreductase